MVTSSEEDTDERLPEKSMTKVTQKSKKKKKAAPTGFMSDDDVKEPPKQFTVYINIDGTKVSSAMSHSHGSSSTAPPFSIQKGPFFHTVNDTLSTLHHNIILETPCNVSLLAKDKLTWRFNKPANALRKQLTTVAGYKAMIASVKNV